MASGLLAAGCDDAGADGASADPSHGVLPPSSSLATTALGPNDLFRVAGAAPVPGGFLIFENRDPRVRLMSRAGEQLRETDIVGEGPGEFREVSSVAVSAHDSVIVFDASLRRVSILSPEGTFVRSVQLWGSEHTGLGTLRPLPAGWVVSAGGQLRPGEHPSGRVRPEAALLHFSPDGQFVRVIRTFPGPELFFGEGGGFVTPLLGRRSPWGATRNLIVLSTGDDLTLLHDPTAQTPRESSPRVLPPIRPLVDSDHEVILDSLSALASSAGRSRIRATYEITSLPATMPRYGAVVGTGSGLIWIGTYPDPRKELREWVLLDPGTGAVSRRVELPRTGEVLWASDSELLAIVTDASGAERAVLFTLQEEAA
jgi:hypothetical protein